MEVCNGDVKSSFWFGDNPIEGYVLVKIYCTYKGKVRERKRDERATTRVE
jgi:hypothetical protein